MQLCANLVRNVRQICVKPPRERPLLEISESQTSAVKLSKASLENEHSRAAKVRGGLKVREGGGLNETVFCVIFQIFNIPDLSGEYPDLSFSSFSAA